MTNEEDEDSDDDIAMPPKIKEAASKRKPLCGKQSLKQS